MLWIRKHLRDLESGFEVNSPVKVPDTVLSPSMWRKQVNYIRLRHRPGSYLGQFVANTTDTYTPVKHTGKGDQKFSDSKIIKT